MDDKHKWQDAHVGGASPQVALRVTEDEKDRLDELRRELRLTSKGQVMRVALDLLERFMVAGAAIGLPTFDRENWHDTVSTVQEGVKRLQDKNARENAVQASESTRSGERSPGEVESELA